MSLPPIARLPTTIFTRTGLRLHTKLNYLTLKHALRPSLQPYPVSARLKAVESMLTSPIVQRGDFCEITELAAGRRSMHDRQYFTVAPTTHQLTYMHIPNPNDAQAPDTRLVNCTDTTVPANTPHAILYLHGGAYVGGCVASHAPFACHISKSAQCNMYFLDYHCAPEYSLDLIKAQAIHAYQHMTNVLHIKPHNIILAGDSAGGGLVLLTLQTLRDKRMPLPRAAWCIAPWGDMSNSVGSRLRLANLDKTLCQAVLVSAAEMATGNAYAAKTGAIDLKQPGYSPLHGSFTDLPSLHISVGTHETLYDDSIMIAQKAQQSGVDVTLNEMQHCFHNWPLYHQLAHESNLAYQRIIDWTTTQFMRSADRATQIKTVAGQSPMSTHNSQHAASLVG